VAIMGDWANNKVDNDTKGIKGSWIWITSNCFLSIARRLKNILGFKEILVAVLAIGKDIHLPNEWNVIPSIVVLVEEGPIISTLCPIEIRYLERLIA
tara:strand:- start:560 stop:850 length:291 start_codon:yes stop_codon:yes gene_type:complete